jgi:O-6-methylguanine DNA methyltransferase
VSPLQRRDPGGQGQFGARVLAVVRRIPAGKVATYGDVAELAGRPRAARAVGNVMKGCGDPGIPCHRVIGAGGALGGYGGNLQLKRELLRREGLEVGVSRVRGFAAARWQPTLLRSGAASFPSRPPR